MKRTLLGVITPSSNTVLEPMCQAMVSGLESVSMHFGRFRVTRISLGDDALGQFDLEAILGAADLLSDAMVQNIVWSGTAAGWLGFDRDVTLCREIEKATGVQASSSVLALNEVFETTAVKKFGLVSPYIEEIQGQIISNYLDAGYECVSSQYLKESGNFSFSEITEETIREMILKAAEARPDAIVIFCTNMRGARLAESIEKEIGIPVYDSVSTGVWKGLKLAGIDTSKVKGWGQLFQL